MAAKTAGVPPPPGHPGGLLGVLMSLSYAAGSRVPARTVKITRDLWLLMFGFLYNNDALLPAGGCENN